MGGNARPSLLERISEEMASSEARRAARADAGGGMSLAEAFRWAVADNYQPVVVLLVIAVVLGIIFRHHLHWGDVPTWVLAATTLLAFVAAAFAGVVAYGLLSIENDRGARAARDRAERREAELREQAGKVAAWYGTWRTEVIYSRVMGAGGGPPSWPHWGAIVRNASDLPVYDARISFCIAVDPAAGLEWRQTVRYSSPDLIPVIPPGEEKTEIPDGIREQEEAGDNKPRWLVAVEFTDADGRRWLRDPRGKLSPAG